MSDPLAMSEQEVFAELKRRGVAVAEVCFSGGGDEGGVDAIVLFNAEGTEIGRVEEYIYSEDGLSVEGPHTVLYRALSLPVDEAYGGFASESYVVGVYHWDVTMGRITAKVGWR